MVGGRKQDVSRFLEQLPASFDLYDPKIRAWAEEYFRKHRARYASDFGLVERLYSDGGILEVGSMPLQFTACLAMAGYPVVGLDIDPKRGEGFARHHDLRVLACNVEAERIPADDASFSLVLFNEIFEHLRIDPIFTMAEVARVLRPGGMLVVTTPNLYSASNLLRMRRGLGVNDIYLEYEKLRTVGHMGHVREYSPKEVVSFLARFGLRDPVVLYRDHRQRTASTFKGRLLAAGLRLATRARPSLRSYQVVTVRKTG